MKTFFLLKYKIGCNIHDVTFTIAPIQKLKDKLKQVHVFVVVVKVNNFFIAYAI